MGQSLFQFESDGMRDILALQARTASSTDRAQRALPSGPMQNDRLDFIKRQAETRVTFEHPVLEPILKGTPTASWSTRSR